MSGAGQTELRVVAGKGGVGRSTVAVALARRAADEGRRVLVVDALADGGTAAALGLATRPVPGTITATDGPSLLELDTEASLAEYLSLNLRAAWLPTGTRSLGPVARLLDYVATAAPAVTEILTIGKIAHEVRRGPWDLVVVDGPATGHGIELLSAPAALGELVGFGPLVADTAWMTALLARPETAAIVVAVPEELVITETLELVARLRVETEVGLEAVVVNRVPPAVGTRGQREATRLQRTEDPLGPLAAIAVSRHVAAVDQRARLDRLEVPVLPVDERLDDPMAAVLQGLA